MFKLTVDARDGWCLCRGSRRLKMCTVAVHMVFCPSAFSKAHHTFLEERICTISVTSGFVFHLSILTLALRGTKNVPF